MIKNLPTSARDLGWIPGLERSPGEGNGNPLHYPCLGNPMDRWAWWATVHGVAKSWAQLSPYMCVCAHTHTHKSVLQGEMLYINIYRFLQSIWVLRKGETNIYLTHHVRWEKRYTGELYFKTQCTKSPAFKTEKLKGSYLHNKFSVSFYKRIHHGVPL